MTCLLTLRPGMPHICGFLDGFSFSRFLATSCCFYNLRVSSLNSELNSAQKKVICKKVFLHYKVRKNKKMTKAPSFETLRNFLTCLLTLIPRMPHIGGFLDSFSFTHFWATSCCFYNLRLSPLKSEVWIKEVKNCSLDVLVCCCAANQYWEIDCVFSKILKNSARSKG